MGKKAIELDEMCEEKVLLEFAAQGRKGRRAFFAVFSVEDASFESGDHAKRERV